MPVQSAGAVGIDLVLNGGKYEQQVAALQNKSNLAANRISGSFKKIGTAVATALSARAMVRFGKDCTKLGSDLAEVQNVVDVTFSTMNTKLNAWAKNAAASYGLSETMAKKFAGLYGTMAQSSGLSEKAAYDMSTALTGLAADVASFYNMNHEEAYTKLKAVFSGETEVLKDIGIVMTQDALNSYALANGINKTVKDMTQAEKVSLRYEFILNQLSAAQGDFTRTQNNWANQVRVLQLRFDSLKATIGQGLINALTPTLKIVNKLIERAQVLAEAFSSAMGAIFGVSSGTSNAVASTVAAEQELTESAEDSASSVDDVTDSINKSAKAAKGSVASFDKLNILSKPDSDESSSSGSSVSISKADTSPVVSQADSLSKKISEKWKNSGIVKYIKEISDITKKWLDKLKLSPLVTSVKKLKDAFKELAKVCGDKLKSAYKNILLPLAKWTIEKALPKLIEMLAKGFELLAKFLKKVPLSVLAGVAAGVAAFVASLKTLAVINKVKTYMGTLKKSFESLKKWIGANPYAAAFVAIATAITAVVAAVKVYQNSTWENTSAGRASEELKMLAETFDDVSESSKEAVENANEEISKLSAGFSTIDTLKDKLVKLIEDGTISDSERAQVNTLVDLISEQEPEFASVWDELVKTDEEGNLKLQKNADKTIAKINEVVESYKKRALADALSSQITDMYSQYYENQDILEQKQKDYDSASQEFSNYKKEHGYTEQWQVDRDWNAKKLYNNVIETSDALKKAQYNQQVLNGEINSFSRQLNVANGDYSDFYAIMELVNSGLVTESEAVSNTGLTMTQLESATNSTAETMKEFLDTCGIDWEKYGDTVAFTVDGHEYTLDNLKNMSQSTFDYLSEVMGTTDWKSWGDESITAADAVRSAYGTEISAAKEAADVDDELSLKIVKNSGQKAKARKEASEEWQTITRLDSEATDKLAQNSQKNIHAIETGHTSAFEKIGAKAQELWNKLKSVFTDNFHIGESLKNIFKNALNYLIDGINGMMSDVVGFINDKFSTFRNWEIMGKKPFDWLPTFTAPQIPRFAKGAIVKAPTLAVVGDNPGAGNGDPEVISPLSKLQSMMSTSSGQDLAILTQILDYLKRIYEMFIVFRNNGGNMYEFIATLNGEVLFQEIIKQNELYKKRHNGQSAF